MNDQKTSARKRNYGKNNKLTSPGEWLHVGRLFDPNKVESISLQVGDERYWLFREKTLPGFIHALSPQDIEAVLSRVPPADLIGIAWFAQLQPTHKHDVLRRAWASYYSEVTLGKKVGSMVVLYAFNLSQKLGWKNNSLRPFDVQEITKLEKEGHYVSYAKRGATIALSLRSIAATQHRSLLHEIGHHLDRKTNPLQYERASKLEKEKFAEQYVTRYADTSTE